MQPQAVFLLSLPLPLQPVPPSQPRVRLPQPRVLALQGLKLSTLDTPPPQLGGARYTPAPPQHAAARYTAGTFRSYGPSARRSPRTRGTGNAPSAIHGSGSHAPRRTAPSETPRLAVNRLPHARGPQVALLARDLLLPARLGHGRTRAAHALIRPLMASRDSSSIFTSPSLAHP